MKNYRNKDKKSCFWLLCLSLVVMLMSPTVLLAQDFKVSGSVIDEGGQPVIGAAVMIKNTTSGVVTEPDGTFMLNLPTKAVNLVVSSMGYETKELEAFSGQKLKIVLKTDKLFLDDIVVIGYGSTTKKEMMGSVGTMNKKDLKGMPINSLNDALQGKVAGLTVTQSSGAPGAGTVARIRGIGSINGSTTPLYIVDGLPQNSIDYLNPNDIESIAVHKDASVAAIYGSRGANGIIIVTTKGGTFERDVEVTYDAYTAWLAPYKRPHMLDARQYIEYKNIAADNAGMERVPAFATQERIDAVMKFVTSNTGASGTDWWKEIVNDRAFKQNHNLSISGGSKNISVLSSLSFTGQDGIVKGSDYKRISWRNSFNAKITDKITFGANVAIIHETKHLIDEANPYTGTIFTAMGADPITPVFRNNLVNVPRFLNNIYNGYEPNNKYSQYSGILFSNKVNPVGQIERMRQSKYQDLFVKAGANLSAEIIEGLTSDTHFGFDLSRSNVDGLQPRYALSPADKADLNIVVANNSRIRYLVAEQTLQYKKQIGDLKLESLLGVSAEQTDANIVNASIQGVVNNDKDMAILNAGTVNPAVSGYPYNNSLLSYFGRLSVNYAGKYLFAVNVRRDGSSKFAKGNKWGTFPSVSAGWVLSEEKFMSSTKNWLSNAKLRVSYGHIGNQNISGGMYYSTYGSTMYDTYCFGDPGSRFLGAGVVTVGNPKLKWETSKQFDFGLDLSFLENKIEFTADYFNKKIEDMLMKEPQPAALGLEGDPFANVGSMKNEGFEFSLTYRNDWDDFGLVASANVSTYKNEVLSLGRGDAIYGQTFLDKIITKTEVGQPVGYFYGYKTNGIFQNEKQVEGGAQRETAVPGDVRYWDIDGNDIINDNDKIKLGSPWPDFVYGLSTQLTYKGFDLNMFFQGSYGNKIMNMAMSEFESGTGYLNARSDFIEKAWHGEGTSDRYHRISANQGQNSLVSDYFLEDGSYFKVKNVQIGYNFCDRLIKNSPISYLRLYASVQNLLTITNYSGLDPEIGSGNAILNGIDQGFYPQARVWTIGLNLKF